jgi:predicted hotdog family 3-hydroxylacyl-ACP dehydratase
VIRDRAWIAARIPHAGSMCLLERVVAADSERIVCSASSHRDPGNPLRARGCLSAVHAIEYAAQAMALHGALAAGGATQAPARGMLTSVRGVTCLVDRLDDIAADLTIEATRVAGERDIVVYAFSVRAGERELVTGRASAVLDAAKLEAQA